MHIFALDQIREEGNKTFLYFRGTFEQLFEKFLGNFLRSLEQLVESPLVIRKHKRIANTKNYPLDRMIDP